MNPLAKIAQFRMKPVNSQAQHGMVRSRFKKRRKPRTGKTAGKPEKDRVLPWPKPPADGRKSRREARQDKLTAAELRQARERRQTKPADELPKQCLLCGALVPAAEYAGHLQRIHFA